MGSGRGVEFLGSVHRSTANPYPTSDHGYHPFAASEGKATHNETPQRQPDHTLRPQTGRGPGGSGPWGERTWRARTCVNADLRGSRPGGSEPSGSVPVETRTCGERTCGARTCGARTWKYANLTNANLTNANLRVRGPSGSAPGGRGPGGSEPGERVPAAHGPGRREPGRRDGPPLTTTPPHQPATATQGPRPRVADATLDSPQNWLSRRVLSPSVTCLHSIRRGRYPTMKDRNGDPITPNDIKADANLTGRVPGRRESGVQRTR